MRTSDTADGRHSEVVSPPTSRSSPGTGSRRGRRSPRWHHRRRSGTARPILYPRMARIRVQPIGVERIVVDGRASTGALLLRERMLGQVGEDGTRPSPDDLGRHRSRRVRGSLGCRRPVPTRRGRRRPTVVRCRRRIERPRRRFARTGRRHGRRRPRRSVRTRRPRRPRSRPGSAGRCARVRRRAPTGGGRPTRGAGAHQINSDGDEISLSVMKPMPWFDGARLDATREAWVVAHRIIRTSCSGLLALTGPPPSGPMKR